MKHLRDSRHNRLSSSRLIVAVVMMSQDDRRPRFLGDVP